MIKRTIFLPVCACAVVLASGPANAVWTKDPSGVLSTNESVGAAREQIRARMENHCLPAASRLAREITLEIVGREADRRAASATESELRPTQAPMAAIGRRMSQPDRVGDSAAKRSHTAPLISLSPNQEGLRKLLGFIGISK